MKILNLLLLGCIVVGCSTNPNAKRYSLELIPITGRDGLLPAGIVKTTCKLAASEAGEAAYQSYIDRNPKGGFYAGLAGANKKHEVETATYHYCLGKDGYQEKRVCIRNCN